jgi:hypothetical protein
MATPNHCTVCKNSSKRLLHHLNQSLACKAHYMASEKAAATVPTIVSNDGHVNVGILSQGSTPCTLRPNLRSYLSRGLLPVFESGGTVGEADDELRVEDVYEVEADFLFDDDAVPEGDADNKDISKAESDEGPETIHIDDAPDPILLCRLAETYDRARRRSFAHADNGSMACTANDHKLFFAYRPLSRTNVRLFDAGHHAHRPVGVGFLCVPVANRGNTGGPSSVFIRTKGVGHIHFPHRLRRLQDIYIILQPTASRGGLTFTEALIAPTAEAHLALLPSDQVVWKLCTEHAPVTAETILNPIDGMTCNACHSPPAPDSGLLPVPPDGNARPSFYGHEMAPAGFDFAAPINNAAIDHPSYVPPSVATMDDHPDDLIAQQRPAILDADAHFPEFS